MELERGLVRVVMTFKIKFNIFTLIFLLLVTATSFAKESSSVLTLEDASSLALKNYELISIGRETVVQGKEDVWKVISQIMPVVTVDGRYTTYSEQKESSSGFLIQPEDSSRIDVKLKQPLYSGGRATSAYNQAKQSLEIKKNLFELTKEEVIILTASSFYNVLKSKGDVAIKGGAHKRALEHRKAARLRLKVGSGTKADLLSAEAEEAGANAEVIRADGALVDSYIVLERLIGEEYSLVDTLFVEPVATKVDLNDIDTYLKQALINRKELKNSIANKEIAELGVRFVKGSFLPTLSLEGQYSYREQTPETTFFQNEQASASVVFNYPVFEGGLRKAELDESVSLLRQAELRLALTRKDIEVEVRRNYNNVVYLNNLIKSFSKQRDFAEENYQIIFKQYRLGLVGSVEVTTADSLFVKSERDFLAVKFDYEMAKLHLNKSIGSLSLNDRDVDKESLKKNNSEESKNITNEVENNLPAKSNAVAREDF